MMINKAFIEEIGSKHLEDEMRDVYDELRQRNIPVQLFTDKRIRRRQLPLTPHSLVVGYVPTMLTVFKLLGIQSPATNDYPSALKPFLHRRIWKSTVQELVEAIYNGSDPIFAKPSDQKKRFTGHVFRHPSDLVYIEHSPRTTPIFCSDVLIWLSEYRVFVINGKIVGIRHYQGDSNVQVDQQVVNEAVHLLNQSSETTAAYGIDFGVIREGQTALVEWNDGFSLGSYGLDKAVYTDILIARWCELTGC